MGHEVLIVFSAAFPGTGDRKDKAPTACCISLVPILTMRMLAWGAIGRIPTHDHQLRPPRGTNSSTMSRNKAFSLRYAAWRVGNDPKAHWHAIPIPGCHQQDEEAEKPGMMLADAPFCATGFLMPRLSAWLPSPNRYSTPLVGGGKVAKSSCTNQLTSRCTFQ